MKSIFNRFVPILVTLIILSNKIARSQTADSLHNGIIMGYEYYYFDWPINNPWNLMSLEYNRTTKHGPLIGRVTYADRGVNDGVQFEVESYPRFSRKIYGYVNLGYSSHGTVFPGVKAGASVYLSLPHAWEIEIGGRVLHFDKNVVVGVAGLSKYYGNYLFNARSFISANNGSVSQSYFLSARRYFGEKNNYVMLQAGTGTSPDESRNLLFKNTEIFSSRRINALINLYAGQHHKFMFNAGYSREQFVSSTKSNLFQVSLAYGYRF